jgi:CBS domain-containing membrane protein
LDALFRQVELKAHRRLHAQIRCGDIMSRDVVTVDRLQPADQALDILYRHDLRVAPVLDGGGRVAGIVRRAELFSAGTLPVASVLDPKVHKVGSETPIEALLPLLSSGFAHEVMVVDQTGLLIGVVTQTDLLAVLYRAHIVESLAA